MVSKKEELLLRNKSAFKQLANNWCRNLVQEVLAQLWILVESFDHLLFHRFFLAVGDCCFFGCSRWQLEV